MQEAKDRILNLLATNMNASSSTHEAPVSHHSADDIGQESHDAHSTVASLMQASTKLIGLQCSLLCRQIGCTEAHACMRPLICDAV